MTSSAAAGVYLERHVANLRLGMSLELFTAIGALVGGSIAFLIDERFLSVLFAALLGYVAFSMVRAAVRERGAAADPGADGEAGAGPEPEAIPSPGSLASVGTGAAFLASVGGPDYEVRNLGRGVVGATGAGVVSALLGVGGGIIKVPLMNLAMGVPLRVATATSNLMVGITAAASAVIYLLRGEIDPYVAGPTAIGVFLGATLGSRVSHRIPLQYLRLLFVVVLLYTAVQMLLQAIS